MDNFFFIPAKAEGSLFLDQITGAYYAIGLIKLRDAYSGGLIEIRRSSDNAIKTFYPDINNELSLNSEDGAGTSLSTWIGSDNGFVRTWYDQTGNNRDWIQTTNGSQPQIVTSGTINTLGGKPVVNFTSSQSLLLTLTVDPTFTGWNGSDITNFFVGSITARTSVVNSPLGSGYFWYDRSFTTMDYRHNSTTGTSPRPTSAQQYIMNFYYENGVDLETFFDNVSQGATAMNSDWNVSNQQLGGDTNSIAVQEFIVYDSNKSADISTGNGILNTYYSVY